MCKIPYLGPLFSRPSPAGHQEPPGALWDLAQVKDGLVEPPKRHLLHLQTEVKSYLKVLPLVKTNFQDVL